MLTIFIEPLLDVLGPLLQRREDEDTAPNATNATIARLDERIAAQLDALMMTGGAGLSSFMNDDTHVLAVVAAWTASSDPADHARAWTYLTESDWSSANLLMGVVMRHGGAAWRQYARSQSHKVLAAVFGELPAPIAWLDHDAPVIRTWAWRHLAATRTQTSTQTSTQSSTPTDAQVAAAIADPLTQEACITYLCQQRDARLPRILLAHVQWSARLAEREDAGAVSEILWAAPANYPGLASLGRVADVDRLIEVLAHPDPAQAIAAGIAVTQMTGADIASQQRVMLPVAEGEDPAFADDAWLPDQQRAQQAWRDLKPKLGDAWRIARGYRIEDSEHPELPRSARRDLLLRRCRAG